MRRGFFLKERFGVNGSQNAARSLGTSAARDVAAGLAAAAVVIGGHLLGGLIGGNDGSGANLCPVGESLSKDAGVRLRG